MTYGFPLAKVTPQYLNNFLYWHLHMEACELNAGYDASGFVASQIFMDYKIDVMKGWVK